ncbi:M3 family peptidase [Robertkochia marina]|uniref:M3 family peptidase n=1 Tax=Robertkochia marina TaxID=1227945 RepID=A0A4S3M5A1_9FLAO|nr:M3 family metallopeptidase [Robertkochia marina]THD69899.1 M3 family peptidase [Robertkochia marina]TRZ46753.1 M3 family peptidase [Robertkochia marina]
MNLLNKPFDTPFQTPPFSKIKTPMFREAILQEISKTRKEIDHITNNPEPPDFKNTIEALDFSGEQLEVITSVFFNLNNAETSKEMQELAQELSPALSEFANDIRLNSDLFQRVKAVYDAKDTLDLNPEQEMLLDKKYKSFSRNGANLPEAKKKELREIDQELAKLSLTFGENVLAETNAYELHIMEEEALKGLPKYAMDAAAEEAKSRNKEGWVFTLNYPSYIPFMTYAENRDLRKKLHLAFSRKGFQDNEHDNTDIILKIVNLRHKRAQLLGYQSHAHFILEERMAKTPEEVNRFLEDLLEKASPAAKREFKQLSDFARETDSLDHLEKWDGAYYTEKLKQKLFELDDEKLKPYFQLEKVINGVFDIAGKLYGLYFTPAPEVETYHQDVKAYKVVDENEELVAIFYADFHPREGKRNGAWMTSFKPQYMREGKNSRPHISIVCNFTKPTANEPSLLTFNEVTTLFHEFGHALHGMLANTEYPSLSGTSVYWDFVELPSQVLENWCYEKEALELFARHYKTGEMIPMDLVEKIKESATFMEGMQTLRQLSFGMLDMSWHGYDPSGIKDVKAHEKAVFEKTDLYPDNPETCMSTAFAHIFQGGYSAGYYSYKWAEVLDADAFELFKEKGVFDRETAIRFKDHVLSRGGTEDPMELYRRFRGKDPQPEALLKRAGLLEK